MKSLKINAVLNIVKQSFSVLFPLLTFSYVSRILGSDEFGKYTFAVSVVNYFSLFAAFGITNFGVREGARIRNDRKKISEFASQVLLFNIITTVISYIALFCVLYSSKKLMNYSLLILLHSLCILFVTVGMDWINTVFEDYLYITVRYIVIQVISLILIFLFVKDSADTWKYCLILVFASYGGNLINIIYIRRYVDIHLKWTKEIINNIKPLAILFVNSLAVTIYVNSDITMLGFYLNDKEVGIYSFASKIYNILKYLINAAIIVAVPRMAYFIKNDKKQYEQYLEKIFHALVILLLPVVVGASANSTEIIFIAGGKEYISGDLSFQVLNLALVFALFASLYTNCMMLVNRMEEKCLIATIISACVNLGLNIVLIPSFGIIGAAVTTVIAEMLNFLIQVYFGKKYIYSIQWFRPRLWFTAVAGGLIVFSVTRLLKLWICVGTLAMMIKLMIILIVSGLLYSVVLFIMRDDVFMDMATTISGRMFCK